MRKPVPNQAIENFNDCVKGVQENIGLYSVHVHDLEKHVDIARTAMVGGADRGMVAIKLRTIAGIIAAMHKSSTGKKGRTVACEALLALDTFALRNCGRKVANANRLAEIVDQDMADRGVRKPRRSLIETRALVTA